MAEVMDGRLFTTRGRGGSIGNALELQRSSVSRGGQHLGANVCDRGGAGRACLGRRRCMGVLRLLGVARAMGEELEDVLAAVGGEKKIGILIRVRVQD